MGYDLERKEIIFMTREGQKIMMVQDNFTGTLVGECGLPVISSENETRCAATIIARLLFHKNGPIMKGLEIVEVRKNKLTYVGMLIAILLHDHNEFTISSIKSRFLFSYSPY